MFRSRSRAGDLRSGTSNCLAQDQNLCLTQGASLYYRAQSEQKTRPQSEHRRRITTPPPWRHSGPGFDEAQESSLESQRNGTTPRTRHHDAGERIDNCSELNLRRQESHKSRIQRPRATRNPHHFARRRYLRARTRPIWSDPTKVPRKGTVVV
jgi:hypothetical protein